MCVSVQVSISHARNETYTTPSSSAPIVLLIVAAIAGKSPSDRAREGEERKIHHVPVKSLRVK
jgi:hypothetical protein